MDIQLDELTHDVVFNNSNITLTAGIKDSVAQRLKIKLLTFLGEWFLDTTNGMPYIQQIFGKVKNKSTIDAIFQQKILEEPGVLSITSFESTLGTDRRYSVKFSCLTSEGETDGITLAAEI